MSCSLSERCALFPNKGVFLGAFLRRFLTQMVALSLSLTRWSGSELSTSSSRPAKGVLGGVEFPMIHTEQPTCQPDRKRWMDERTEGRIQDGLNWFCWSKLSDESWAKTRFGVLGKLIGNLRDWLVWWRSGKEFLMEKWMMGELSVGWWKAGWRFNISVYAYQLHKQFETINFEVLVLCN